MKTDKSGVDTPATLRGPQGSAEGASVLRRTPEEQVGSSDACLEPETVDARTGHVDKQLSFCEIDQEYVRAVPEAQLSFGTVKPEDGDDNKLHEERVHPVQKTSMHGPEEGSQRRRTLAQAGKGENGKKAATDEKFQCGDCYWSGRSASDDCEEEGDVILLLSANPIPCVTDDESHYITTHEILLAELSDNEHDVECGSSTTWDVEDGNQVCPFARYASFDGEGAARGALATLRESDPSDTAKSDTAEESLSKPRQLFSGTGVGQIQLSIRATSRAINGNFFEEGNILYRAARSADVSRYVIKGAGGEALRDRTQCYAAAPGRVHFGRKFRAKDASSGTSSAVSEPDDADKEVRTLTAKTFKSLAHPYFDAVNFGASSESSASERGAGMNRWSTFVDMKYGDMSQKLDKTIAAHQNSTASFEMAKNHNTMFAQNTSGHDRTSSDKVELMGKFNQGQSGVITLTETLNFRCNVKSGASEGEKHLNRAHNAVGSRSTDDVTDALRRVTQPLSKPKEDANKKAIFASSLIKNVISKKMQFEQERKMERGEISEQHQGSSPYSVHHESGGHTIRRQGSKVSECSLDCAVMNAEDLGDIAGGGSGDARVDSRGGLETIPFLQETHVESAYEAGFDSIKGTLDASKRTLLRSQNSAFRRWKDGEVEFQKDHKTDQTPEHMLRSASVEDAEGDRCTSDGGKRTKMSHLFVPSIQLLPSEREVGQQLGARNDSVCGDGEKEKARSDNKLYVADSRNKIKSKSPEIKINLRSVKNNQMEPVAVSKLQASNVGYNNTASMVRNKDFRCQTLTAALKGESVDKVPHFTVRDIRDNKAKLQTPIHQVRDVRKLVKSSYHFVSLDNENRPRVFASDRLSDQKRSPAVKNPMSVSPIVIKCQSVNTNSSGKQSESFDNHRDLCDTDGAKNAALQWAGGAVPVSDPFGVQEGDGDAKTESRALPKRQPDLADKKTDSKMASQMALEKLQAAVRTMEQLYVFEKNEWRRKAETRLPMDSHVLSMIASEEHGELEGPTAVAAAATASVSPGEDKQSDRLHSSVGANESKNVFSLSSTNGPRQKHVAQSHLGAAQSSKVPESVKSSQLLMNAREGARSKELEKPTQECSGTLVNNENYLTIPVKSRTIADAVPGLTFTSQSQLETPRPLQSGPRRQEDLHQCSSAVVETATPEIPFAAVYPSLSQGMTPSHPQFFCFSPAITPTPALEPFQAVQRKILLDPTTGSYYLVDSPAQPPTKRLFDPETGQYVEVPMAQPSTTPVPMSVSPLALGPGAYGHTYMIYPGFVPTTSMISAQALVQSQMVHPEGESAKKPSLQRAESTYLESPFYITTGKSTQPTTVAQQQGTSNIPLQPIISITSQQGPRIVAPPSFDGTTMSFVVEHR